MIRKEFILLKRKYRIEKFTSDKCQNINIRKVKKEFYYFFKSLVEKNVLY